MPHPSNRRHCPAIAVFFPQERLEKVSAPPHRISIDFPVRFCAFLGASRKVICSRFLRDWLDRDALPQDSQQPIDSFFEWQGRAIAGNAKFSQTLGSANPLYLAVAAS
jgi:hypothetical protein